MREESKSGSLHAVGTAVMSQAPASRDDDQSSFQHLNECENPRNPRSPREGVDSQPRQCRFMLAWLYVDAGAVLPTGWPKMRRTNWVSFEKGSVASRSSLTTAPLGACLSTLPLSSRSPHPLTFQALPLYFTLLAISFTETARRDCSVRLELGRKRQAAGYSFHSIPPCAPTTTLAQECN